VAYSQFARQRCHGTPWTQTNCNWLVQGNWSHYMGYSARTAQWRYTLWVQIDFNSYPNWTTTVAEELYDHSADYSLHVRHTGA